MTAQSKKAVSRSTSPSTSTRIAQDIAPADLLPFLSEAFKRVRRTAADVIEIGMRLLILKEITPHGKWLNTINAFGISSSVTKRIMSCARRFCDKKRLVAAAGIQWRLFELLKLDDDELYALDAGETVHGLNLDTIGKLPVSGIHLALKGKKAGESNRVLKPDLDTPRIDLDRPTWPDTEEKSCVNATNDLPPASGPVLGEKCLAGENFPPETYPAVYTLLPGEFNGLPISIIRHEGRSWLMAEEIIAVLGDLPDGSPFPSVEHLVDFLFRVDSWSANRARVRLASSILVMRILDKEAVRYLCELTDCDAGRQLVEWFCEDDASGEPAAVVPITRAKPRRTLKEALDAMDDVNHNVYRTFSLVEAQIKAISAILMEWNIGKEAYHIDPLVEIAEKVVSPWSDLFDQQDDLLTEMRNQLEFSPEDGAKVPEYVWLDLVSELITQRQAGEANEHMSELARIVGIMAKYGTPEVESAVRKVEDYVRRQGAYLYDHAPSGRVAFAWEPGRKPVVKPEHSPVTH